MRLFRPFTKPPTTAGVTPTASTETLTEMAKHLRQVQFYYLLVCLGLLLAVYLPRDTTLDKATTQLDEVIRFQSEVGDEPLWRIAGMAAPDWAGPREPRSAVLFRRSPPASQDLHVCFIYDNEILRGSWPLLADDRVSDFRYVETHQEFTQLWDTLASEDAFLRVRQFADAAFVQKAAGKGLDTSSPTEVQLITDAAEVKQLYAQAFSLSKETKLTPSIAKWVDLDQTIGDREYTRGIQLVRSTRMLGEPGDLILPVELEPARLPILNRLLDHADVKFQYLSANDYWLVHEELADWTLGGKLDQLSLYSMRSVLGELRVAQSEKFPVFGFGIPYELLFKYGLLVLVTVQVFFWGHLRSFRLMSASQVSRVWAPWLPLYPNLLSRLLTVASIVVLPMAVILHLLLATDIKPLSTLFAALGMLTACQLFSEFVRMWRNTTKREHEIVLRKPDAA